MLRLLSALMLAAASASDFSPQNFVNQGHRRFYEGRLSDAVESYRRAIARSPRNLQAWLNGAVVLEELGRRKKAVEWYARAAALAPSDPEILTALGWAEFRDKAARAAETHFRSALTADPKEPFAWLGLGRVELAACRAGGDSTLCLAAADDFAKAGTLDPASGLAPFWKGQALESADDLREAVAAYQRAAIDDSYFVEARYALARAFLRRRQFPQAAVQFEKVLEADPENRVVRQLEQKTLRLIPGGRIPEAETSRALFAHNSPKTLNPTPNDLSAQENPTPRTLPSDKVPMLRVGIGTNAMGRPLPRRELAFECSEDFDLLDARTGHPLLSGSARELWRVLAARRGGKLEFDVLNSFARRVLVLRRAFVVRTETPGLTTLFNNLRAGAAPDKILRGEVEIAPHPDRRGFRIINRIDLENYVGGVLSAEMPIRSPLEALKTQAVIARSHALYLKTVLHRHRRDGYDLCDGQHCQVYAGVLAESDRSKAVVEATRGRIVAFRGRVAQVPYSADCGGHTQDGEEVAGWGDMPYWKGIIDAPPGSPPYPQTPWELSWWLKRTPPSYCMPSELVYPSHYRWVRVIDARELTEKLNSKYRVGQILGILPLRRSASGHLNSALILGRRKNLRITQEINLRSLLGIGSQRSTLFMLETEYGADGAPQTFVFFGGGWGHGVGLCQSGAIGRAQQGQTYAEILRSYFRNTELGDLRY